MRKIEGIAQNPAEAHQHGLNSRCFSGGCGLNPHMLSRTGMGLAAGGSITAGRPGAFRDSPSGMPHGFTPANISRATPAGRLGAKLKPSSSMPEKEGLHRTAFMTGLPGLIRNHHFEGHQAGGTHPGARKRL